MISNMIIVDLLASCFGPDETISLIGCNTKTISWIFDKFLAQYLSLYSRETQFSGHIMFSSATPEMQLKVIFWHPKCPPKKKNLYRSEMARIAIESEFQTSKMADRSEMARNAIKRDFWTSKMSAGDHFVKKKNGQKCDWKWISDIQNGRRQPFCQKFPKKNKVAYQSEMAGNAIESEFRTSKMADRSEMARNAIESDFRTFKMAVKKNSV